jgi:DNA mismatch repair protein MutS
MKATETPLVRQYNHIKAKHPDTVLLFRLGDFYETFGEDAVITASACGITLTKRNNGGAGETPLAGFPHHQLDTYLPKLVRAGHRVAVCEQLEDPKKAKGIVKRDVVEVVTPGVVMYDKLLDRSKHTWIVAVTPPHGSSEICGFAACDVSTGTLMAGDVPHAALSAALESLHPAEVLLDRAHRTWWDEQSRALSFRAATSTMDSWLYDEEFTRTTLLRHFDTASLKGFGIEDQPHGMIAAGALLHYVSETQRNALRQIVTMSAYRIDDVMLLDAATRRNLEITSSMHDGSGQGTLVTIIDRTVTPMGARLLRWWLQSPLLDRTAIDHRLDAVAAFVADPSRRTAVHDTLRHIGDIERLTSRVVTRRAHARDLAALRDSLAVVPTLRGLLGESPDALIAAMGREIDPLPALTQELQAMLADEPPLQAGTGRMFRAGVSPQLDVARDALVNGKQWIADYQEHERQRTGISTLKIGSTGVFGYYIEVSNANKGRIPEDFERKQTLVNAERFTTERLRELERTLMSAETDVQALEASLLDDLMARTSMHCGALQQLAARIAHVDCLVGFAEAAVEHKYVRPEMHDGDELRVEAARHPVIETLLPPGTSYVPNDIRLDATTRQMLMLTGPNMSGKSSYLRQVGLIVFLAHVGSFVPARSALIPMTDRIFTRVGAQDNIVAGESTFLVEMQEAANILNNATGRSLILLDEVGRGTATYDGISIAWAIAEYLHNVVKAKTLFATHYHELTELAESHDRIHNVHVEVQETGDDIVFTHRVIDGHSDHSFGIHVARMAGLPPSVVATARGILRQLEQESGGPSHGQLTMFEVRDDRLRDMLQDLDLNSMTPLQALQTLSDLKASLNEH